MSNSEPEGEIISGPPALRPDIDSPNVILGGPTSRYNVLLSPLLPEHSTKLFTNVCGPKSNHLYKYIAIEPFPDLASFTIHLKAFCANPALFPFVIRTGDNASPNSQKTPGDLDSTFPNAVGIISLLNIVPEHRTIEIGHVLFGPSLQRTTAATECLYLLMKYCFEELHYLRVEWKTNSFNEASRRAALRLGFVFEGIFRKHMIVKGRRRDSAWFSITDDEWFSGGKGGVKLALEKWLDKENFDEEGKQRRKLEDIRNEEIPVR